MTPRSGRLPPPAPYDACIITTIHPSFDKRVYRQLCALADEGLSVCIIAPWDFSKRDRSDYAFVATAPPSSRPARAMHAWRTFQAARKISAAVYIFHDPDFLPFALPLKRLSRVPVVYDCHENIPEDILYGKDWIPRPVRAPISAMFRAFENFVVRRLGLAIVTVPHLERRFSALGVDAVQVRNYPRLTVPAGFQTERAVLYTGTVSRDYGAENLLGIAAEMKRRKLDIPFRIVDLFHGEAEFRQTFLDRIASEDLPIEILPPVPSDRMAELLAMGSIGLSPIMDMPNKALALPTKIFEYYKFGLVVITSDVDGSRLATEDGRLGLLVAHDKPDAWTDAIELLLRDQATFDTYRDAGLNAAETRFNWNSEAIRLTAFVEKVAGLSARSALAPARKKS